MANAPLYQTITQDILDQIQSQIFPPGHRLESESALAVHYGVSRMTVRQALGQLESDGLVTRKPGSGTFVNAPQATRRETNRIAPFHEELGVSAEEITTVVELQEVETPPESVAEQLFTAPGASATHLIRVRKYKQRPIAVQESWVPYLRAPQLSREPLIDGSLYKTLGRLGLEVATADQRVTAVLATERDAVLLKIEVGSPLIRTRRTAHSSARDVVEVAESVMLPEFPIAIHLRAGA
ncbi:GntR family transcriptional regulator [Microbacterium sp. KHB019]|uniref:GntR family transcriptional regulator n=1 Tax=Microbacterium sp. KHB019 TaxID=3129770 RepID=UPI00307A07EB